MTRLLAKAGLTALSAGIVALTLGASPAAAQTATCPCLFAQSVDYWYGNLGFTPAQPGTKSFCANEPTFTTMNQTEINYVENTVAATGEVELSKVVSRALLIDVVQPTSNTLGACTFESVSNGVTQETYSGSLTAAESAACLAELQATQTWTALSCPPN